MPPPRTCTDLTELLPTIFFGHFNQINPLTGQSGVAPAQNANMTSNIHTIAATSNAATIRMRHHSPAGADLTVICPNSYNWGHLDLSVAANYNKTEVTRIKQPEAQLAPQSLIDATAISDLETASPLSRTIAGAL